MSPLRPILRNGNPLLKFLGNVFTDEQILQRPTSRHLWATDRPRTHYPTCQYIGDYDITKFVSIEQVYLQYGFVDGAQLKGNRPRRRLRAMDGNLNKCTCRSALCLTNY